MRTGFLPNQSFSSHAPDETIPVFAYMRRSTDKVEQKDSIIQQEEGIQHLMQALGINKNLLRFFSETKSGFENRKRPKWREMIAEIDATKKPCILLCRDTSRLSRNPRDNLVIADRIFGDSKTKKTIGHVFFLGDNFNIQEWNERSDKKYIVDKLHQNYIESLETKTKSVNGHILKLQAGIYPYHPAPRGLDHIVVNGKKILRQNDQMPFIKYAFEMKAENKGHKEIATYLKKHAGIKIGYKELTGRYFDNTVYIGHYTEKNTKQTFTNLIFLEGKPPITESLWSKVQRVLGKRGRIHRDESQRDVFEEKGKTATGGLLSRDIKKGKHVYYKNTKAKVNVSQKLIIGAFNQKICDLIWVLYHEYRKRMNLDKVKKPGPNEKNQLKDLLDYTSTNVFLRRLEKKNKDGSIQKHEIKTLDFLRQMKDSREEALDFFKRLILGTESSNTKSKEKETRDREINKLQKQKEKLEEDKKEYRKKAVLAGFSKQEIDDVTDDLDKSIALLDEKISEFSSNLPFEDFIEKLPLILLEIVELVDNALNKEQIEDKKKDLMELFEITVANFSVDNKKELKIKLFDVLDRVIMSDNSVLEAPAGVEPASRALQAPVGPFYQGAK